MKKLPLLISLLSLFSIAQAQITITENNMPSVNDTFRYSTTQTVIDASRLSQRGTNQTWDFSDLVPDWQEMEKCLSPSAISPLYGLTFNGAYGLHGNFASLPNIPGNTMPIPDVYNFYKKSAGAFVSDGRGMLYSGLPLSQTYQDSIYRFPLNYGQKDSCHYSSEVSAGTVGSIKTIGKRVNGVDGWGSITTPYGTFNCLRVHSVLKTLDSVQTSAFPFPIAIVQVINTYTWLSDNEKFPILEVTVTEAEILGQTMPGVTTIRFLDRNRPELFENAASFTANKTSFNMASAATDTCILSDASSHQPITWEWTITPSTYTFTGGSSATSQNPKLFFTAAGTYTIKLKVTYSAGSDEELQSNLITVTPVTGLSSLNMKEEKMEVYPNPAKDIVNINTTSPIKKIALYDSSGKEQTIEVNKVDEYHASINTSQVAPGSYIIKTNLKGNSYYLRCIVIQ
jgi:PKD repeat protein